MKGTPAILKRSGDKVIIVVDEPDAYNVVVVKDETKNEYSTVGLQGLELFQEFLINGEKQWISPTESVAKMFATDQGLVKLTREFSDGSVYVWKRVKDGSV